MGGPAQPLSPYRALVSRHVATVSPFRRGATRGEPSRSWRSPISPRPRSSPSSDTAKRIATRRSARAIAASRPFGRFFASSRIVNQRWPPTARRSSGFRRSERPRRPCAISTPRKSRRSSTSPIAQRAEGQRDHVLLSFLYNTGARIQEALNVCPGALRLDPPTQVRLFGKGRKERICPLWPETADLIQALLRRQPRAPDEPIFRQPVWPPLGCRRGALQIASLRRGGGTARAFAPIQTRLASHLSPFDGGRLGIGGRRRDRHSKLAGPRAPRYDESLRARQPGHQARGVSTRRRERQAGQAPALETRPGTAGVARRTLTRGPNNDQVPMAHSVENIAERAVIFALRATDH